MTNVIKDTTKLDLKYLYIATIATLKNSLVFSDQTIYTYYMTQQLFSCTFIPEK